MAQQTINVGTAPNDGTGTPLRTAFQYTNSNFSELYTAVGPSGNNIVVPGNATITGDLTVDTNTFFVDSANNRVGIGTTTIASTLTIRGTLQTNADYNLQSYYKDNGSTWLGYHLFRDDGPNYLTVLSAQPWAVLVNGSERFRLASDGVATWSNVGGVAGTAMTLNSTGLGVGSAPSGSFRITAAGSFAGILANKNAANQFLAFSMKNSTQDYCLYVDQDGVGSNSWSVFDNTNAQTAMRYYPGASGYWHFLTNNVERLRIDSSGNVGIGVTPSASAGTSTLTVRSGAFNNVSTAQTVSIADVYGGVIVITGVQGGLGSSTWTIPFVKRGGTLSIGTASKAVLTSDPISSVTVVSNNISITPVAANTFITFFIQYTPLGT